MFKFYIYANLTTSMISFPNCTASSVRALLRRYNYLSRNICTPVTKPSTKQHSVRATQLSHKCCTGKKKFPRLSASRMHAPVSQELHIWAAGASMLSAWLHQPQIPVWALCTTPLHWRAEEVQLGGNQVTTTENTSTTPVVQQLLA